MKLDLEDLDAALDGLANAPAVPATPPGSDTKLAVSPPPVGPPPLHGGIVPGVAKADSTLPSTWGGRQAFVDLFLPDAAALPPARGGLDEKVEFFRDKVKRAEAQAAKVRDAWQHRERELDTLEKLLLAQTNRAEDLHQQLFAARQELDAANVQLSTKNREAEEAQQLHAVQQAEAQATLGSLRGEAASEIRSRDAALAELKQSLQAQAAQADLAQQTLDELREQAAGDKDELLANLAQLQSEQAALSLEAEGHVARAGELRMQLEQAERSMAQLQRSLAEAQANSTTRSAAAEALQVEVDGLRQTAREQTDAWQKAVRERDEAIATLRATAHDAEARLQAVQQALLGREDELRQWHAQDQQAQVHRADLLARSRQALELATQVLRQP